MTLLLEVPQKSVANFVSRQMIVLTLCSVLPTAGKIYLKGCVKTQLLRKQLV